MRILIKTFTCEEELNKFLNEKKRIKFQRNTKEEGLKRILVDVKVSSDEYWNQTFLLIYKTNEDFII